MSLKLSRAEFPQDAPVLETLFGAYLNFIFERTPEDRAAVSAKYPPDKIPELVAKFADIHARPKGELLLARLDGTPVGCAMMRELEPGIVEIQRVYVTDAARGHGVGKALTLALMERARKDGQTLMRLDTGKKSREAVGLYRALGFEERAAYHADNPELEDALCYFECVL